MFSWVRDFNFNTRVTNNSTVNIALIKERKRYFAGTIVRMVKLMGERISGPYKFIGEQLSGGWLSVYRSHINIRVCFKIRCLTNKMQQTKRQSSFMISIRPNASDRKCLIMFFLMVWQKLVSLNRLNSPHCFFVFLFYIIPLLYHA